MGFVQGISRCHVYRCEKIQLEYSPNRACLYGVLATNLLISWGTLVWPRAEDVVVFSETAAPFTFSIRHFSESCCGCSETHNYVLRHPCSDPWVAHFCHTSLLIFTFSNCAISLRPLLSSTSFKHDSNYKHSGSGPFLVGSTDFKNSSYF